MFKKILAFFMTAVIAAGMLCVTVSADYDKITVESPKKVTSGKQVKGTAEKDAVHDYKIVLGEKGTLKVSFAMDAEGYSVYLYRQNGSVLESVTGKLQITSKSTYTNDLINNSSDRLLGSGIRIYTDSSSVSPAGVLTFKNLDKGTYYLRFTIGSYYGGGSRKFSFTATFPEGSGDSSDNDSASGDMEFMIYMDVGDSFTLATLIGSKEVNASWSSSNKNVVSVTSKGKVKAKKEGTAIITAKSGSSKKTIKIVVED